MPGDPLLNAYRRKQAAYEAAGQTELAEAQAKAIRDREKALKAEEAETLHDLTKAELLDKAAEQDIEGRSSMNKDELIEALGG